jgi:hypothetical protein
MGERTVPSGVAMMAADGATVQMRRLDQGDADAVRAHHATVSDRSYYLRYFTLGRATGDQFVSRLTATPDGRHDSLGVHLAGRLIAIGYWVCTGPAEAEVALLFPSQRNTAASVRYCSKA